MYISIYTSRYVKYKLSTNIISLHVYSCHVWAFFTVFYLHFPTEVGRYDIHPLNLFMISFCIQQNMQRFDEICTPACVCVCVFVCFVG